MAATGAGPMYASMGVSSVAPLLTASAQASSIKAAGRYKASLARTNSELAGLAEDQTIEAGDIGASRKNLETKQRVGSQLAVQGASGVNVNSGSSAISRKGVELAGALDEMTIRNNAARQAFGYKIRSIQDDPDIENLTAKSEAEQTLLSGGLKAISNPLSIYSNYLRYSRSMTGGEGGKIPESYLPGEANG